MYVTSNIVCVIPYPSPKLAGLFALSCFLLRFDTESQTIAESSLRVLRLVSD
jgi:hypothetical protein